MIRDRIKELRRMRAGDLYASPRNWRTHPEAQVKAVQGILAEIGYADALLARELPDGTLELVDGHLRKELDPDQIVPVLILDIDQDEANKLLTVLDPLAALAETNKEALESLLAEIDTESEALQAMLDGLAEENGIQDDAPAGQCDPDETPEPPADPITKPGDLWILGEHRLLCGDSTKAEDVSRVMNGVKAEVCFTSPPYNANTKAGDGDIFNGRKSKRLYAEEYGDNRPSSDYVEFARCALRLCFEYVDGFIFWNVSYNKNARFEYIEQITPWLPHLIEQICWKKHSAIPFKGSMRRAWEPIYLFSTSRATLGLDRVESNFWDISNTDSQADNHKACFPVALPARAIELINGVQTVYEPFCGSGTTIIAAEQLGRRCFGIEISPAYCDVIVARWEKFTGRKAQLEKT